MSKEPVEKKCVHGQGVPLGPNGTCLFCERDASRTQSQRSRVPTSLYELATGIAPPDMAEQIDEVTAEGYAMLSEPSPARKSLAVLVGYASTGLNETSMANVHSHADILHALIDEIEVRQASTSLPPHSTSYLEPPIKDLPDGSWQWWDREAKVWQPETTDAHRIHRLTRERDGYAMRVRNGMLRGERDQPCDPSSSSSSPIPPSPASRVGASEPARTSTATASIASASHNASSDPREDACACSCKKCEALEHCGLVGWCKLGPSADSSGLTPEGYPDSPEFRVAAATLLNERRDVIAQVQEAIGINPPVDADDPMFRQGWNAAIAMIDTLNEAKKLKGEPECSYIGKCNSSRCPKHHPSTKEECDWADGMEQAARVVRAEAAQPKQRTLTEVAKCLQGLADHYPSRK